MRLTLPSSRPLPAPRRGTVLIITIGILAILTALVLVLARNVRTEATASANYSAAIQAESVELAAEQYSLAVLASESDQFTQIPDSSFTAIPVGNSSDDSAQPAGYFWIIRPTYDDPTFSNYGFVDESAKLNINNATAESLECLPGMSADIAEAIVAWRDPNNAINNYYMSLPQPYTPNGTFESVEQLLLVQGFNRELLYGQQYASSGRFMPYSQQGSTFSAAGSAEDPTTYRGLFDFLTVYSAEPPATSSPTPPNSPTGGSSGGSSGGSRTSGSSRSLVAAAAAAPSGGGSSGGSSSGGSKSGTGSTGGTSGTGTGTGKGTGTTTGQAVLGRINVNTAPREVLACIPNLTDADVDAIVSHRSTAASDPTDISWLQQTLGSRYSQVQPYVTGNSYQFSADIVAVSANGRAFKRVRVVIDTRNSPVRIIYRRDLTDGGWPLDPDILSSLRSGAGVPGGPGQSETRRNM